MKRSAILKYLRGETSAEERIEMLQWLEEDPVHLEEYKYLRRIFDATLCNEENIPLSIHSSQSANRRRWMQIAATVAFICLFAGGTWLYTQHFSEEHATLLATRDIHVPVGQRTEITLNDGTRIWLNSNTTLHIESQKGEKLRRVCLNGEAYFEVAPDKHLPFVVQTGSHEVQVLGTKFSIFAYKDRKDFSVKLYEGAVNVSDRQNDTSLCLSPDEEAKISDDGRLIKAPFDKAESLLWIEGIYYFEDTDYGSIFRQMKEYYKVDFDVRNPQILHYKCTCKFRQEDGLKHILEILQQIHRFEYEWSNDEQTVIIR
ncbi:FecR domain-containing protein [Bacteroides sp. AN502(2024)]|uniref:FecR domain-containing protein n=1 Tax=Bacteroides sp. AN502(2024) TaxID=3160599 RepID=UPI0035157AD0